MNMVALDSLDALNAFTANNPKAVVIVSRTNCPACDALSRALQTNAEMKESLDGVAVATAKLEQIPQLATTFGLRMAPSTLTFVQDDETGRVAGFQAVAPYLVQVKQALAA